MGPGDLTKRCFPKLSGGDTNDVEARNGRLPRVFLTTEEIQDMKRIGKPGDLHRHVLSCVFEGV